IRRRRRRPRTGYPRVGISHQVAAPLPWSEGRRSKPARAIGSTAREPACSCRGGDQRRSRFAFVEPRKNLIDLPGATAPRASLAPAACGALAIVVRPEKAPRCGNFFL